MPYKPKERTVPEDYPEQYQYRPKDAGWIAEHQAENMRKLLGEKVWCYLKEIERKETL